MPHQHLPVRGSRSYCYNNNNPDNSNLKILYYNTRSIVYKIDELSTNCSLYCPDIVCITETLLNADVRDSEVNIPNYQLVRLDQDRHGGGIVFYIANHLSYSVVCSGPNNLELLAISEKEEPTLAVQVDYPTHEETKLLLQKIKSFISLYSEVQTRL